MRAIGILVVMLTLLFLGGQAKADNLGELKEECEELENFWRLYPPTEGRMKIPSRVGAAICFGYMEAIEFQPAVAEQRSAGEENGGGRPLTTTCRKAPSASANRRWPLHSPAPRSRSAAGPSP
jgi:hypothetical protein